MKLRRGPYRPMMVKIKPVLTRRFAAFETLLVRPAIADPDGVFQRFFVVQSAVLRLRHQGVVEGLVLRSEACLVLQSADSSRELRG